MEATATAVPESPSIGIHAMPSAARTLAHGLNALLGLAALVLLLRSLAGGFSAPINPWLSLAAIGLMAAIATCVRRLAAWRRNPAIQGPATRYGPPIALAAAFAALALARTGAPTLMAGALLVLLEEAYCTWKRRAAPSARKYRKHGAPSSSNLESKTNTTPPQRHLAPTPQPDALPATGHAPGDDSHVLQQVWRIQTPNGTQRWQGWCRTRFEPSARHAVEHLSFCPPFLQTPRVDCRPLSGPSVRLRVSRVLPHGASVELRLNTPSAEPTSVTFEFSACVGPH